MNIKLRFGVALTTLSLTFSVAYSQNSYTKAAKEASGDLIDAIGEMDAGDFKTASSKLGKIISIEPGNDAALYYSGLCDLYLNNLKDAQTNLKKASEIDPKNYWYKDRLAIAYSAAGEEIGRASCRERV